jgi:transposase-like protein
VSVFPYLALADAAGEELVRLREEARTILRQLANASDLKAAGVEVIPGNLPARELQRLSEQDSTGVIVVGSTHRGAVGRVLPGAAAEAGVSAAVGVRWFREGGGMPSVALGPPSGRYLSFAEREEIALLRARGCGVREIARRLGRSPSTISRELRRNAATRGGGLDYRASSAQWHADRRSRRPKPAKLAVNPELRRYVEDRLAGAVERPDGVAVDGPAVEWIGRRRGRRKDRRWARSWSPEQISYRLRLDFCGRAAARPRPGGPSADRSCAGSRRTPTRPRPGRSARRRSGRGAHR